MRFTDEQLDVLGHSIGIFRPPGFNDNIREDMCDKSFLAVDSADPLEIDDAVRVSQLPGGKHLLQVAVADGSQLRASPDLVADAITLRWSAYRGKRPAAHHAMLPPTVTHALELNEGTHRALVISREYSADMEPSAEVRVTPATVSIQCMTYHALSVACLERRSLGHADQIIQFNRRYRQTHGLHYHAPEVLAEDSRVTRYGERIIETAMVLANIATADWSIDAKVPLIYRNFDKETPVWDESALELKVRGTYDETPQNHSYIARFSSTQKTPYTQVTSPLRRSIDLVNHLQIGARLGNVALPYDTTALSEVCHHINREVARPANRESTQAA